MNIPALIISLLFVACGLWCARCLIVGLKAGVIEFPGPGKPAARAEEPGMFVFAVAGQLGGFVFLTTIGGFVAFLAAAGMI